VAFLAGFGSSLPTRVVANAELAALCRVDPNWILDVSGIEERRWAAPGESAVDLAITAARDCLESAAFPASDLRYLFLANGSQPRRFPGPAAELGKALGLEGVPCIDIPMASAGALFAVDLARHLPGPSLVVAAEKMSTVVASETPDKNTAILFGDGAGACLVHPSCGRLRITDSVLHSDGSFAPDLELPLSGPLVMNGRAVIMQATRKLPAVIREILERNRLTPADIAAFIPHQANRNLLDRVAASLGVPAGRFFSNIARYGNTSSASVLIAAAEWSRSHAVEPGSKVCFAVFGAGFHWGALLAESL
jgi:3-oxoacyl-[acyl-carrier-protein] synthase-3